jgi:hypothetical protein
MGIPLSSGRMLNDGDRVNQPRVTVVNSALAMKYFRGEDPMCRRAEHSASDAPGLSSAEAALNQ